MPTPDETPRVLTPEEFLTLPQARYEGEVVLAETPEDALKALARLQGQAVLGFDTETRPTFKKGVSYTPSLVQLAGEDLVVLMRPGAFPAWDHLAEVLGNALVVKAGVAVRDDRSAWASSGRLRPRALKTSGNGPERWAGR